MATKISHRIFTGSLAVLFFVTAFGFSFLVIWQLHQSSSSTGSSTNTAPKLAGTKLSDFTPVASVPSLQITDKTEGRGQAVTSDKQTVTVEYTGAVASTGIIFQSSYDSGQALTDPLDELIQGWQQGMLGMKVDGTRQLLIPASEAYGADPPAGSGIPPNAALVFDITLLKVS
jgi:FKBP-type peptidyl-prolyl cis-trans isomerase